MRITLYVYIAFAVLLGRAFVVTIRSYSPTKESVALRTFYWVRVAGVGAALALWIFLLVAKRGGLADLRTTRTDFVFLLSVGVATGALLVGLARHLHRRPPLGAVLASLVLFCFGLYGLVAPVYR